MGNGHIIHYCLLRRVELKGAELSLIVWSYSDRLNCRYYSQIVRGDCFDSNWHLKCGSGYQRFYLNHPRVARVKFEDLWNHG